MNIKGANTTCRRGGKEEKRSRKETETIEEMDTKEQRLRLEGTDGKKPRLRVEQSKENGRDEVKILKKLKADRTRMRLM